jgi:hypothetical protein
MASTTVDCNLSSPGGNDVAPCTLATEAGNKIGANPFIQLDLSSFYQNPQQPGRQLAMSSNSGIQGFDDPGTLPDVGNATWNGSLSLCTRSCPRLTPQFSAPEPGTMSLVGLSLIGIAYLLSKRVKP